MIRLLPVAVLLFALTRIAGCAPDPLEPLPVGPTHGWAAIHPVPVGYDLNDVWGTTPTDIWAVGDYGVIVQWNGDLLRRVDSPVTVDLVAMDGWRRDDLYAVGRGVLLHFDGRTWEIQATFPDENLTGVLCGADGKLYLTGTPGFMVRRDDGWDIMEGPSRQASTVWDGGDGGIWIGDGPDLWRLKDGDLTHDRGYSSGTTIVTGDHRCLIRQRDGWRYASRYVADIGWFAAVETWSSIRALVDTGEVIYATNAGIFYRGDLSWENSQGRWINHMTRCGEDGILACGKGGTLMYGRRTESAITWREAAAGLGFHSFNALAGTGDHDIWAGEWYGRILHYDGSAWIRESASAGSGPVSDLQVLPDGWIAAQVGGEISLRGPDGVWESPGSLPDLIRHFQAVSPDSILAVTETDVLVRSGGLWRSRGPLPGFVHDLAATPAGRIFALATGEEQEGRLLGWTGTSFETLETFSPFAGGLLCASPDDETLWVGVKRIADGIATTVYRHRNGRLENVSGDTPVPGPVVAMSERGPDDLFVLTPSQPWRLHGGRWSRERGLPEAEYLRTLWCAPDGGVYVAGQPLFHKDYTRD